MKKKTSEAIVLRHSTTDSFIMWIFDMTKKELAKEKKKLAISSIFRKIWLPIRERSKLVEKMKSVHVFTPYAFFLIRFATQ